MSSKLVEKRQRRDVSFLDSILSCSVATVIAGRCVRFLSIMNYLQIFYFSLLQLFLTDIY